MPTDFDKRVEKFNGERVVFLTNDDLKSVCSYAKINNRQIHRYMINK